MGCPRLALPDPDAALGTDAAELGPADVFELGLTGCMSSVDGRVVRWGSGGSMLVHKAMLDFAGVGVCSTGLDGVVGSGLAEFRPPPLAVIAATTSQFKAVARVQQRAWCKLEFPCMVVGKNPKHRVQSVEANEIYRRWIAAAYVHRTPETWKAPFSWPIINAGLTNAYRALKKAESGTWHAEYLYDGRVVGEPVLLFVVLDDLGWCEATFSPGAAMAGLFGHDADDADM